MSVRSNLNQPSVKHPIQRHLALRAEWCDYRRDYNAGMM